MIDSENSLTKVKSSEKKEKMDEQQQRNNLSTMLDMGFTRDEANDALNIEKSNVQENKNMAAHSNLKCNPMERKLSKKVVKSVSFKEEAAICKLAAPSEALLEQNVGKVTEDVNQTEILHDALPISSKNADILISKPKSDSKQKEKKSNRQRNTGKAADNDYVDHSRPSAPATLFDFLQANTKISDALNDEEEEVEEEDNLNITVVVQPPTQKTHRTPGPPSNLPPRLQKKQMREEMERVTGKKYSTQDECNIGQKQYDVNSRGPVVNRSLWSSQKLEEEAKKANANSAEKAKQAPVKVGAANYNSCTAGRELVVGNVQVLQRSIQQIKIAGNEVDGKSNGQQGSATSSETSRIPALTAAESPPNKQKYVWKQGDHCLAKWKDNQFYPARILKTQANKAVVEFLGYPGSETIYYEHIIQMPSTHQFSQPTSGNFHYNNSLPPDGHPVMYPHSHAPMLYHPQQGDMSQMGSMLFQPGNAHMMLNQNPNFIVPFPNQVPSVYSQMPEHAARHRQAHQMHSMAVYNQNSN